MLTLSLQCAGMVTLIACARTSLALDIHKLGHLRSALLMVRFTTAIIALHIVEIMLWAGFYRALCFPSWESAFYFSAASRYNRFLLQHVDGTMFLLGRRKGSVAAKLRANGLFGT